MSQPKIVLFDVETSLMEVTTFTLYPEAVSHKAIVKDWFMICAAWKVLNSKSIQAVSVLDDEKRFKKDHRDDYHVVKTLRDVLADASIIVGHNAKKFDIKKLNARLIFHGIDPLPSVHMFDTLTELKKVASFTSHRLDYLGTHLGFGGKLETDHGLWPKCSNGEPDAIGKMVKYNKVDVKRLEDLYLTILPYSKTHPHVGAMRGEDKNHSCPKCGSTNLIKNQTKYTAAGLPREQYQCKDCHSYSTAPKEKIK